MKFTKTINHPLITMDRNEEIEYLYQTGYYSQADLGSYYHISRERVRQIIKKYSGQDVIDNIKNKHHEQTLINRYGVNYREVLAKRREWHKRMQEVRAGKRWNIDYDRCIICGRTDSKHASRGRCERCLSRIRYANPTEREKHKKAQSKYFQKNKEKIFKQSRKYFKKRWETEPEFREQIREYQRKYYAQHKTNPKYIKRTKESMFKYYHKKRAIKLGKICGKCGTIFKPVRISEIPRIRYKYVPNCDCYK